MTNKSRIVEIQITFGIFAVYTVNIIDAHISTWECRRERERGIGREREC